MREAEATVSESPQPVRVHHLALGLNWTVREVLGSWTHRGWPEQTYRKPVVERRLRLRVFGPLPGQPQHNGEFVMIATAYGDRHSWWIRPEIPGQQPSRSGRQERYRTPRGGALR